MTSGAFHLLSKTLPKKLRTDNPWALWPEPGGQGPSPTAEQLQGPCQSFKPGQQKGRGLGIRKSWAHFAALPFTRCVTVGKSLSVSESQERDNQSHFTGMLLRQSPWTLVGAPCTLFPVATAQDQPHF